jgi:hypothetical protein
MYIIPGGAGCRDAVRVCSGGTAGLAAIILALGRMVDNSIAMIAALVLLVSGMALGASIRLQARPHQLWGSYQGQLTCLFESTNERMFGQVTRALVRAVESQRDTPDAPQA